METTDSIDPGSIVANQYGLVRNICQNLPDLSLDSCFEVNSLWAKAVDTERKKRKIVMFHWKGEAKNTQVISFQRQLFEIYKQFHVIFFF